MLAKAASISGWFGVAFILFASGSGFAADLARKTVKAPPPPPPAPVYNWTGWYVGLNAGAAIGHATQDPTFSAPNCTGASSTANICPQLIAFLSTEQGMNSTVFTGGGQLGYNWQWGGLVYGFEADVEYMPLRGSFAVQSSIPAPVAGRFNTPFSSGSVTTDWLVTIRPRVGWAFDRFLVYGTGGLAVTHQHNSLTDIDSTTIGGVIGTFNATSSQTVGWTAGGGIEYAFSNSWSVKAEYLYLDFGNVTASAGGGVSGLGLDSASVSVTSHLTANIVRAGLNYQFH